MFVELHNHTSYSLLDSNSKLEDIIDRLKELGQNAIAITEHGNVFSSIKMYKLCKENNIKFIYGCEFYICNNIKIKDPNSKYNHLIILAKNEQGRINLNKLLSIAHIQGKYYKPRIDFEILKHHSEGLVILSACLAGEIQKSIVNEDFEKAEEIALRYKKVFGKDYYLEIQSHDNALQNNVNIEVIKLAQKLNIKYVVTTDSHYITKDDSELHNIFIQIGTEREVGETYADCYLQSEEEVRNNLRYLPKNVIDNSIKTTCEIAEKCNSDIPLSAPIIPHITVPEKFKNEIEYLKHLCVKGWNDRGFDKLSKEDYIAYQSRLLYEFDAVTKMGFEGYYLMVYSYATSVRRRGIARGSGGGSLIAYLLNITDIDPVKYGLWFERFIDVSALELLDKGIITKSQLKIPDIDLDFGKIDRENIMEFIINKYGQEYVASICAFQYMWDKSSMKDVGRVLGVPFEVTNEISKVMGDDTIENCLRTGKFNQFLAMDEGQDNKLYHKLFDYAQRLTGLPRSFSTHASGKIIALQDLTYYTALYDNDGSIVLQADMNDVDDIGLVKIDVLGLRTIDVIYDVLDMTGKDYDYIKPQTMNFNDQKVLEIFKKGHTDGIFQFESDGMKQVLMQMQPDNLDDLAVANALYRPGAKKYIKNYIDRKFGREEFEYLHPDLEEVLKPTYGIIVFQEQLIEIGRIAGMSNPDLLRKATAKKKPKLLAQVKPELQQGLYNRGWSQQQVDQLWEDMLDFASYSFNKSHSYAYAIIAFITAFLKVYHPVEFSCALINSFVGKLDRLLVCNKERERLDVKLNPYNFRTTSPFCKVENGKITYGTALIKNCNAQISDELNELRDKKYYDFIELLSDIRSETSVNSKQLKILIKLNFFSEFGGSIKLLKTVELFGIFYERKEINKKKILELNLNEEIFKVNGNETEKKYTKLNWHKILYESYEQIPDKSISITDLMKTEIMYLGYTDIKLDLPNTYAIILDKQTPFTHPMITLYYVNTGIIETIKCKNNMYNKNKFQVLDLINIIEKKKENKWTVLGKDKNGKPQFRMTDEKEWVLKQWSICKME